MIDYHQMLNDMYQTPNGELIEEKRPIFSIINHATDKYTVNPRFNCLHLSTAIFTYLLYTSHKDLIPLKAILNPNASLETKTYGLVSIISSLVPIALLNYAYRVMKSVPGHEASHAYRMRYFNFMNSLKIKKTIMKNGKKIEKIQRYGPDSNNFDKKYLSFIDRLENIGSGNSIKASIARELGVVLSVPYLLKKWRKKKESYIAGIDEDLAKFDAVWISGIRVNDVSKETEKKFRSLALRTDIGKYVPLNSIDRIEEKVNSSNLSEKDKETLLKLQRLEIDDVNASPDFKYYLENPPVVMPKYEQLGKLLNQIYVDDVSYLMETFGISIDEARDVITVWKGSKKPVSLDEFVKHLQQVIRLEKKPEKDINEEILLRKVYTEMGVDRLPTTDDTYHVKILNPPLEIRRISRTKRYK